MNCEILDLRAFVAVLDLGSFRAAADMLGMSQPALSRRIKGLESRLGFALIERSTRHVALTRTGRELLPHARRLIDDFDASFSSFGFQGKLAGQITIAAIPTATQHFLPRVLKVFNNRYPRVRVNLLDLPTTEGFESVTRGQVEFGVTLRAPMPPELKFTPFITDRFVLACRRDHELSVAKTLKWSEIIDYPLIGSQKSENRTNRALLKWDMRLNWFFKVIHLSTSLQLVDAGLGIAIIPLLAAPDRDHPTISIVPLCEPTVRRTIGIVERRNSRLSPAAMRMREMLLESHIERVN